MSEFKVGDRVKVFDPHLYENDKTTPLSVTMKPAIILKIYEYEFNDPLIHFEPSNESEPVVDIQFDHDGRISCGHFIWAIERL